MKKNNIKRIATIGIVTALSIILVMIVHFPLIPAVSFLEYDPADIPIYTLTLIYGPITGTIITVITSFIQGFTVSANSGIYGIIMHIISTGVFVWGCGLTKKLFKRLFYSEWLPVLLSLLSGVVLSVAVMIPANLLITPYFMGVSVEAVKGLMPLIILFNVAKQSINAVITAIVYRAIKNKI